MTHLPRTLDRVIQVPARLVRTTEFLFRRSDASGDIYPGDDDYGFIPGRDPDHIMFLGEAGQISLGVRTHQLSLAAFFARHHHAKTHRGVTWSIHPFPYARLSDSPTVLADAADTLEGADIVVMLIGITDALRVIPATTWEKNLRTTLTLLTDLLPHDSRVLIAEMPPLGNAGSLSKPARIAAGIHGNTLNKRTQAITNDYPPVTAVGFPEELTKSLWRPESEEKRYTNTYDIWAAHLAHHLTTPHTA